MVERALIAFQPRTTLDPSPSPSPTPNNFTSPHGSKATAVPRYPKTSPSSGFDFGVPFLVCMVVLVGVATCLLLLAKRSFRQRQRLLMIQQEQDSRQEQANVELVVLAEEQRRSQIEAKLGSRMLQSEDIFLQEGATCSVCLNDFKLGEKVSGSSNSECRHYFHTDCIASAFLQGPTTDCPVCRRDFFPE